MSDSSAQTDGTVAVVVRVRPRSGMEEAFSSWHARMMIAPAGVPGFISAEVSAENESGSGEWRVVQHFQTIEYLNSWRRSEQNRGLVAEARKFVFETDSEALREELQTGAGEGNVVTEVVTTHVRQGRDPEYQRWAQKVHSAEALFPGYRGSFLQPPVTPGQRDWTTLVRFATPAQLDAWLNSNIRQELLREHEQLVSSWEHHRLPSSFAAWFPNDPTTGNSPASWKQSLLVVLMLFPIVMLEMKYLGALTRGLNASEATFIGNVISVFLLSWPFMPLIIWVMKWWLLPRPDAPKWIMPTGAMLLFVLYVVEVTTLSFL